MNRFLLAWLVVATAAVAEAGQKVTLLDDAALEAIRSTVSGARVKGHVRELARFHRVQATAGYHQAAEYIRDRATAFGLENAEIVQLPADGETRYHHFRAYYGWQAEVGRLWEVSPRKERIADYGEMKVALADYSQDANVTAELIDVGSGTEDEDYEGRSVEGKIVLAGGALPAVHRQAIEERGAVGMLSYYPNQTTGWSGDDPDLVRWGHLDPANISNRFAFMTSPRKAKELASRLAAGEVIQLHAEVEAKLVPGHFEVVTAVLPGTDLAGEEILFICHLDHQNPGANDNASGAATILEVARTLAELVRSGALPAPRRSLRFVWPPEIAGTYAYLARHPEIAARLRAGIHMDMVGGIPQTNKAVFFLSRPPASVPSFIGDVGEVFFDYVKEGSRRAAADGDFSEVLLSPEGTKNDFVAEVEGISLGSDHEVLGDSTFGVPMLYFHDWPDIYIHTNKDLPEVLDATKLQRVAFLGATTGYTLARLGPGETAILAAEGASRGARRLAEHHSRAVELLAAASGADLHVAYREARNRLVHVLKWEQTGLASIAAFTGSNGEMGPWLESLRTAQQGALAAIRNLYEARCREQGLDALDDAALEPEATPATSRIPERTAAVRGPTSVYYYDYLQDKLADDRPESPLSGAVRYEILNFVDGARTVQEIRDAVSAELDPVPLDQVIEHLEMLEHAGVLRFQAPG